MNEQQVRIRRAIPADAVGVARVNVDSWRSTYRGLIPDHVLDSMSYEIRADMWRSILAGHTDGDIMFVAETRAGEIIGFADGGPNRGKEKEFAGELSALYLLEEAQGLGLGRRLVETFAQELARRGMNSMIIWALSTNPARGFYERMGGLLVGEKPLAMGGANLLEVGYGWPNLSAWLSKEGASYKGSGK